MTSKLLMLAALAFAASGQTAPGVYVTTYTVSATGATTEAKAKLDPATVEVVTTLTGALTLRAKTPQRRELSVKLTAATAAAYTSQALGAKPKPIELDVHLNGLLLTAGADYTYTEATGVITFLRAFTADDTLRFQYRI